MANDRNRDNPDRSSDEERGRMNEEDVSGRDQNEDEGEEFEDIDEADDDEADLEA